MKIIYLILFTILNGILACFASDYSIEALSPTLQAELIKADMWSQECPVLMSDLRLVSVKYYDVFGHSDHMGKIILHKSAAPAMISLFKQLYQKKFPLTSVETLISYHGDQVKAEMNNVTYGFVCKKLNAGFSADASGKVITINPVFNPDINFTDNKTIAVIPAKGIFSVNRGLRLKGMTESVQLLFNKNHFVRLTPAENQINLKNFIYNEIDHPTLEPLAISQTNFIPTEKKVFSYSSLPADLLNDLKQFGYWQESCPISLERLKLLTLTYYDFRGVTHEGHLVVLDSIAPFIKNAFAELYEKKYPLEAMGYDFKEIGSGGTSSFKCRAITGKSNFSMHSFGLAVDINVSRNPYVGSYKNSGDYSEGDLIPADVQSFKFLNRSDLQPGMNEAIVNVMKKYGLIEWGGNWEDRIDYMHFQLPSNIVYNIAQMNTEIGKELISLTIRYPESARKMSADTKWMYLYEMQPQLFGVYLRKYFSLLETEKEQKVINLIYQAMVANNN